MRQFLFLIVLLSPFADEPKPNKGDRDQVVGSWENVSRQGRGEDVEPLKGRVIITRDLMWLNSDAPGTGFGYMLDPLTNPKRIVMWSINKASDVIEPPGGKPIKDDSPIVVGDPIFGIYKLDADLLTVCFNTNGKWPSAFKTEKHDGNSLEVFRRVKQK